MIWLQSAVTPGMQCASAPRKQKEKITLFSGHDGSLNHMASNFALGMLIDTPHSTLTKVLCALQTWE